MPLKFLKTRVLPIGVDLGTSHLKLAQLRMVQQDIELLAAGSEEIPADLRTQEPERMDFIARAIRRSLKSNNFQGRKCVLALPTSQLFLQHLKLPRVPKAGLESLLRAELAGKLPYAVEEAVIGYVLAGEVFGEGEPRQEVIVAAAARDTVETYLELAGKARLEVVGINVESCAVVECFGRLFRRNGDAARTILFVDMGVFSTQVCLTHGDKLVFARNLRLGEQQIDNALAEGMHMDVEQAHSLRWDLQKGQNSEQAQEEIYRHLEEPLGQLAAEITQCLRYCEATFRNQPVERMVLAGGQAYDKRLCQSLAERLNLPAQIGDPLVRIGRVAGAGLQIGLDRREPQPQWAVAVGLSLGAAQAA